MKPQEDPRFGEKVRLMAINIMDAWPDDHNIPMLSDPNRTCESCMQEMAAQMAAFLLYYWKPVAPSAEFPAPTELPA